MMTIWSGDKAPEHVMEMCAYPDEVLWVVAAVVAERDHPKDWYKKSPHPMMDAWSLVSDLSVEDAFSQTVEMGSYTTIFFIGG